MPVQARADFLVWLRCSFWGTQPVLRRQQCIRIPVTEELELSRLTPLSSRADLHGERHGDPRPGAHRLRDV